MLQEKNEELCRTLSFRALHSSHEEVWTLTVEAESKMNWAIRKTNNTVSKDDCQASSSMKRNSGISCKDTVPWSRR
jgi:hypothetical protein